MRHSLIPVRMLTMSACAGIVGVPVDAGDLNPPGGVVSPTMKTLDEVEPRIPLSASDFPVVISQPGSYHLTENVPFASAAGSIGIEIIVDDVTIDLMGFTLKGSNMTDAGAAGVLAAGRTNIHVRNGTVRGWRGSGGVDLSGSTNCVVERIRADDNMGAGIIGGSNSRIVDCVAINGDDLGIIGEFGSTMTGCTARNNGGDGIEASRGGSVVNCTAYSNDGRGILVSSGGTITGCATYENAQFGMAALFGGTVSNSASSNDGAGIDVDTGATVINCGVYFSTDVGIDAGQGVTISNCAVNDAGSHGIFLTSETTIQGCTIVGSAGAGIRAQFIGGQNSIRGNTLIDNDTGILITGTFNNNIVISNVATGNMTNYSISGDNAVGEIINVAGSTIMSSNPWANLEY